MRALLNTFLVLAVLGVAACEVVVGTRFVDPAVVPFDVQTGRVEGDPTLEIGFYIEQLYAPMDDGDECPVVWGLQGGTWTMPALRTQGIAATATVSCTITTETGEVVSEVEAATRFYLAFDGWYENQAMPLPVNHAPPNEFEPIDDLYGLEASLHCYVEDDQGRGNGTTVEIIIAEG